MSEHEKPNDWDWVTERRRCSGPAMFEALLASAHRCVATRNEQDQRALFRIGESRGEHSFAVFDERVNYGRRAVSVRLTHDQKIHVRKSWQQEEVVYGLTLSDGGDCRWVAAEREYQPWQVLRRALEDLFYELQ